LNNSPSLKISLILGTIIMIGTIVLFNNNSIYAKQAIWRDFDNMKDLVAAIRSGEKNDKILIGKNSKTREYIRMKIKTPKNASNLHIK